jgi:Ca2+-binding EF-hand superfamily protein
MLMIKEMFETIDNNNDGYIEWTELTSFLIRLSHKLTIPLPTPDDIDELMNECE